MEIFDLVDMAELQEPHDSTKKVPKKIKCLKIQS
jgi:hypothetical protein